jgi:bacterioferritin-associated ferredoxin
MIVCHCNRIDHTEIETAASGLAAHDSWAVLTPVRVYKALGKRPRCGGCLPLAASIIHARQIGDAASCAGCPLSDFPAEPQTHAPSVLTAAE